jgi:glycosyltransferase involved in cell wall biosynthesis
MRQRPQYVLQEFADRGHPVYFVDPTERSPRSVDGVSIVNSLAQTPSRNTILYVHYAPAAEPAPLYPDAAILYDITDDLSAFAEVEGEGVPDVVLAHHRRLIARAEVVAAAGPGLADTYRIERPDIVYAPNGVDRKRFATPRSRPTDIPPRSVDHPIAGYHGALAGWRFDFDLFSATAALLPDWRFVVVGPVDERVSDRADLLASIPNVTLLGERHADEIGAYVQAFDVGTMWYPLNNVTAKALPMKMNEYLAAGVPCVSTPLPACIGVPGVWTASTPDGYARALGQASEARNSPQFAESIADQVGRAEWSQCLTPMFEALEERDLLRAR